MMPISFLNQLTFSLSWLYILYLFEFKIGEHFYSVVLNIIVFRVANDFCSGELQSEINKF